MFGSKSVSYNHTYHTQAGEDVVAVEGGKSNLTNMFKATPQQKEARRSKLHQELSDAEEALGPAQYDLEQFVSEAELEVHFMV